MYTVKQLADLADVTVRTLHYYDEIGLLHPTEVGTNNYRYYNEAALLRLQQILFYREVGLELMQIKDILDKPDFDVLAALRSHRSLLRERMQRLQTLVNTVDSTMMHLAGEVKVSEKRLFRGFSEEKQKDYEREARLQYGPDTVNESIRRWNSYSEAEKQTVLAEGDAIYLDMVAAIEHEIAPESPAVQEVLERWHQHLRYFYEPTLEILQGLGEMYSTHPDFVANFKKLHPDLPPYLTAAITHYVDELETTEIQRLLDEDEQRARR